MAPKKGTTGKKSNGGERRYAEAFVFKKEGDTIEGRVVKWGKAFSRYGEHPVVTIRTNDGTEHSVHCMQTTLRSAMENEDPKVGESVRIVMGGERENKAKTYKYTEFFVEVSGRKGGSIHDVLSRGLKSAKEMAAPMERGSRDLEPGDDLPF